MIKVSAEAQVGRIIIARLKRGEDLQKEILRIVEERKVSSGCLMVIGALEKAKFGIFINGEYKANTKEGPLEIISCMGNIAEDEKGKIIHVHITVADEKGDAYGGHLMEGCIIHPTAELVIIEAKDLKIYRKIDKETGLKLLSL